MQAKGRATGFARASFTRWTLPHYAVAVGLSHRSGGSAARLKFEPPLRHLRCPKRSSDGKRQ